MFLFISNLKVRNIVPLVVQRLVQGHVVNHRVVQLKMPYCLHYQAAFHLKVFHVRYFRQQWWTWLNAQYRCCAMIRTGCLTG